MHRARSSHGIRTAAAKSSWCWTAFSTTNTVNIRPGTMSAIRRPPRILRIRRKAARCSSNCGSLMRRDRTEIRLDTSTMPFAPDQHRPGVAARLLFQDRWEMVRLERWEPDGIAAAGSYRAELRGGSAGSYRRGRQFPALCMLPYPSRPKPASVLRSNPPPSSKRDPPANEPERKPPNPSP